MTPGRILSVNLARPQTLAWRGRQMRTGIFKEPVHESVRVREFGLEGDLIADQRVHGGPVKAVYAYPSEHYPWWAAQLERPDLPWGTFGENLTTGGWDEAGVHIGDRFRAGTALLEVTQPRMPCIKFALKMGTRHATRLMVESGRHGFYFAVLEPGAVQAGDPFELLEPDPLAVSIQQVLALKTGATRDPALLERVLQLRTLPDEWKASLLEQAS